MLVISATKITTDLTAVTNSTVGGYSTTSNTQTYLFYAPTSGSKALYKKRNTVTSNSTTTTYYDRVEPANGTVVKTTDGVLSIYTVTKTGSWS